MADDRTIQLGELTFGVREAGPADGRPVLHFHGTPGSRLELTWADDMLEAAGVRLVTFDRPGYGRSTPTRYSLSSLGGLALELADQLGWERFSTLGWSGGCPFALATASLAPERVRSVGVMAGAGPFHDIPGALDGIEGGDAEGAALLSTDPEEAAAAFGTTFEDMIDLPDLPTLLAVLGPALSERDKLALADPVVGDAILRDMQEALRQGTSGGGWDNVAWIGPWDFDYRSLGARVHLWYGDEDLMAPMVHARWLADHLPNATLEVLPGYGHLAAPDFLPRFLAELTAD